ncbi:MAG: DUF1080 domain-containing protein [Cyclobacteriaceae bacterium]
MKHFLIMLALAGCLSITAQNLSNFRWTTLDTSGDPTPRHESSMVEHKGKFYILGGRGVNPVDVFDPKTNSWESKSKSPFEIHHFQAVSYGDAIYFAGAMTGQYPKETPLTHIWKYYPSEDRWEQGDEIPLERRRGGAGAVVYQDKLYLVCGIDLGHTSGTNNHFDSYDLKTGEWETLTKAPHIRDHFSAIVVDDKLYSLGGRNTSYHVDGNFTAFFEAVNSKVDVYDFETGDWITLKEALPTPSAAGGLAYLNGHLFYAGGEAGQASAHSETHAMEIATGKWKKLSHLNTGRHGGGAVVWNGKIYMAAGSPKKGGGNLSSIEVLSDEHSWQSLFNGKNLAGWEIRCTDPDRDKEFWKVEDGAIFCNSEGSTEHQYIWLQTTDEYGDFELRLKYQTYRGTEGNSGVQFRSRYDENAQVDEDAVGWLDGAQVDINPAEPFRNGYIYDETRTNRRWVNPDLPDWRISEEEYRPKGLVNYYSDEGPGWNEMTIIAKGTRIKTMVNSVVISDYDGAGVLDDKGHKQLKVDRQGVIALQLHKNSENRIKFKDIEIRELK